MGVKYNITLLSNVGAAGNGAAQTISMGGKYLYQVAGTFAGTSSKLQILGPDGVTYQDVASTTFSTAGMVAVEIPAGASVRSVLTGGTPSGMYATMGLVQGAS